MAFPLGLLGLGLAKAATMSTVATTSAAALTSAGLAKVATTARKANGITALRTMAHIAKEATEDPSRIDRIVKTVKDVATVAKGAHDTVKAVKGVAKEFTPNKTTGTLSQRFYVNEKGEKVYLDDKPAKEKTYTLTESELALIIESAKAGSL